MCVCECVTVNTTLWWMKESRQIFTHSTHLLDVLQAEVAPANKWICVSLIPLFSSHTQYEAALQSHNYMTPQIYSSPLLLWCQYSSKPYCSLSKNNKQHVTNTKKVMHILFEKVTVLGQTEF